MKKKMNKNKKNKTLLKCKSKITKVFAGIYNSGSLVQMYRYKPIYRHWGTNSCHFSSYNA